MKILALESTALVASVAVCEDARCLGEVTLDNGNTHSETLLPSVEFLLNRLALSMDDIDLFAVASGPGSFTGVRIGVATVKGLAFGRNKPCVAVSALEALAENLNDNDGLICPVMNARRDQVYTALFSCKGGVLTRLMDDSAISLSELDARLQNYAQPVSLVGDGYVMTAAAIKHPISPVSLPHRRQSAVSVAAVAKRMYDAGQSGTDAALVPVYLRLSQAERERNARMKTPEI